MTKDELEDAYVDWYFLDDNAYAMISELEDKGYKFKFLVPAGQELSELGAHAVITDEFPHGDVVLLKKLGDPRLWKKLRMIPLSLGTQRAASAARIEAQAEGGPIELYSKKNKWAAFIHPCARPGCEWQGSMFDDRGPFSHVEADSVNEALRELFERAPDWELHPGIVDEMTSGRLEEFKYPLHGNPGEWTVRSVNRALRAGGPWGGSGWRKEVNTPTGTLILHAGAYSGSSPNNDIGPYTKIRVAGQLPPSFQKYEEGDEHDGEWYGHGIYNLVPVRDLVQVLNGTWEEPRTLPTISKKQRTWMRNPENNPPFSGWREGWWREDMPKDVSKISYRRKRDALNVFMDWNQSLIDLAFNGPSQEHPAESFDNFNHKYDLKGRRQITNFAKAVWFALPVGGPYYLEDIDVDMLNDTQPMIHNAEEQILTIPDYAEERRLIDQEAAYWEDKYGDLFPEADDAEVPF